MSYTVDYHPLTKSVNDGLRLLYKVDYRCSQMAERCGYNGIHNVNE